MSGLPAGWAEATLSDVIAKDGRFTDGDWVETKDQDPSGRVRLTQLADVGDGYFRDRSSRFLREDQAAALNCTYLEPGDVLVARMPDPLGRACLFPGLPQPAVTAVDVCIVRPGTDSVEPRWLMWAINAPQFRSSVAALQTGTTRRRISRKNLATIRLPVPPLNEQRRIVAAVEEHLSRLDAADASVAAADPKSVALRRATLSASFNGSAPKVALGDLAAIVRGVTYKKTQARATAAVGFVPILRATNIERRLNFRDLVYVPEAVIRLDQRLQVGDIVLAGSSGSAAVVGKSAMLTEPWEGSFGAFCAVLRARGAIDSAYLAAFVSTPSVRSRWSELAAGTNINNLKREHIAETAVPVPPLEEQKRIVAEVEARLSALDALRGSIERAQRRSRALRAAVLAKAFRGELVPQDPSDEPADALLARIRAERESSTVRSGRGRNSG